MSCRNSLVDVQNAKRYRAAVSRGPEGTRARAKTDATTVETSGKLSFQATYAAPRPGDRGEPARGDHIQCR
ncbi:hypothetical protein ACFWYW_09155 [Nonomuraea sp. NPDC059023]|uniref:hypothetical protein n=1 Tax=unclassified Nonomuraea TaxID=2593643 RepID=UPI003690F1B0